VAAKASLLKQRGDLLPEERGIRRLRCGNGTLRDGRLREDERGEYNCDCRLSSYS
jgi:hypothetical protein